MEFFEMNADKLLNNPRAMLSILYKALKRRDADATAKILKSIGEHKEALGIHDA